MTFTTLTFVVFYALVFTLYWTIRRRRAQNLLIVIASYVFYGWWDWRFCWLMAASSVVDFAAGLGVVRAERTAMRRLILTSAMMFNVGMLGFFKYFNFFAESFTELARHVGWQVNPVTVNVILPVGLSFYTFQTMCYTIDAYRGHLVPTRSLIDYLAYVSYFPQLVAGPIERATNLLPQFQRPRVFDYDLACDGCRQALWGFFKKIALADNLAVVVDSLYDNPAQQHGGHLAVATVFFAFQIYCDFSAYSDIAIGIAKMMGIHLMRNFAYPYFSQDVAEFWRRWHISLSTWFRDYVFVPLGGSRVPGGRYMFNVLLTFAISGLWHGAAWTFVTWGLLNGMLVLFVAPRVTTLKRRADELPGGDDALIPSPAVLGRIVVTFLVVCAMWVFFRARSMHDVGVIFEKFVFEGHFFSRAWGLLADNRALSITLLLFVLFEWVQRRHPHPLVLAPLPLPARWAVYTSLLWITFLLMPSAPSAFIYFQF